MAVGFLKLFGRSTVVLTVAILALAGTGLEAAELSTGDLPTTPGASTLTAEGSMIASMLAEALVPTEVPCPVVAAIETEVSPDAPVVRDMCFDFGLSVYKMCKPYAGMLLCAKLATDLFILCEAWELLTD